MADVYLGVDDHLAVAKLLVVKRVRAHLAEDAEFRELLLEEARVCARLNHPNIVQVFDIGFEDGECFLAMEYLDGQSMHQVIRRASEKLSAEVELLMVCDVLRALHHAHELVDFDGTPLNIVHRDVSPQNVFITYEGVVKLLDFGIAKAAGRATETREGFMRGKIRYMAPERMLGLEVDRRYDVFAAGILTWQAVTAQRFWGDLPDPVVTQRLAAGDYDPSPRAFRPDTHDALDAICRRALARNPLDRYASAAEMLTALEDYLGDRVVQLRRTLIAAMKATFEDDRQKRRAIIEELGSSSAIANALGAIAQQSARSSDSWATRPLVSALAGRSDAPDETHSLANMLEPSMPTTVRKPRGRWRKWLALSLLVAAVASFFAVKPHMQIGARPARAPARTSNETLDMVRTSDAVVTLAARSAAPIASGSASTASSARVKTPPPHRHMPSRRPPVTAIAPAAMGSSTGAPTKPSVDTSDPWH